VYHKAHQSPDPLSRGVRAHRHHADTKRGAQLSEAVLGSCPLSRALFSALPVAIWGCPCLCAPQRARVIGPRHWAQSIRSVGQVALCDVGPLHDEGLQRVIEAQPFLTRLQLGPCSSLTEVLVSAIVLKLPHLTHLALSGCSLLSDGALVCIAEGLPSLKSLLLTESAGFADAVRALFPIPVLLLARLPNLPSDFPSPVLFCLHFACSLPALVLLYDIGSMRPRPLAPFPPSPLPLCASLPFCACRAI